MPVYQPGEIVLNIYQIEAFIGEGGYGEVYRARHIHLQRLCALKILRRAGMTEAAYSKAERRFKQEALLGDQIDHTAIVRCTNYFPDEARGQLVLVMPFVSGGSLTQALKERRQQARPFGVSDTLRIGRQIAAGLAALHAQDVIHRDLSPNNILFDEDGNALIADLGSAQTPLGLTRRDQISEPGDAPLQPGTPGYRSPEHEDPLKPLRPPSDVYALGLLLFEMLTLRRFSYCAPGTRVSALRPDVPAALDELVAGMLSEDPRQRPWDGAAAEQLLGELVAADPVPPPVRSAPSVPAAWTLDEGLSALKEMVDDQEWPLAEDLLKQLDAAYPGNPKLMLPRKRINQALAAIQEEKTQAERRATEEKAAREAAERARQAELARKKAEADARLEREAADRARREAERQAKAETPSKSTGQRKKTGWFWVVVLVIWGLGGLSAAWILDWLPLPSGTLPACTQVGQTWTSPIDGMSLVCVPAGDFLMGSTDGDGDAYDDEKPRHRVSLEAYWMDQTEVSNAMFAAFVSATGYRTTAEEEGTGYVYTGSEWGWVEGANWQHPAGPGSDLNGKEDHPVVQVSWDDAVAYCEWAGRELPSEAEWEKAARGTDGRIYPWGNQAPNSGLLNFDMNIGDTTAVGSYPDGASPYGALDMAGNVWEWCADWYDGDYYSSQNTWRNPAGPTSGEDRVVHGGSWNNITGYGRAADRGWFTPGGRLYIQGFRCRLSAAP